MGNKTAGKNSADKMDLPNKGVKISLFGPLVVYAGLGLSFLFLLVGLEWLSGGAGKMFRYVGF